MFRDYVYSLTNLKTFESHCKFTNLQHKLIKLEPAIFFLYNTNSALKWKKENLPHFEGKQI